MPVDPAPSSPAVIADDRSLRSLLRTVRESPRLAFDTEAASYHRYFDRIYLIQLSSEAVTAIVDPLGIRDMAPLGRLLANRRIEVVFHDADYDLRVLDRDYGFHPTHLFDTRVAAQLLGEPGVGLGALLEKYFDVRLDKKMQRADWSRRPLTEDMIRYAASDTRHLLALRDVLDRELEARGRRHWAQEEFKRLESLRWAPPEGQGFLRIKGAKTQPPRTLAVLKALYEWREEQARAQDRAPFRILGNEALMAVARAAPTGRASLARIRGLPTTARRRFGDDLLAAVHQGRETPPEQMPMVERAGRGRPSRRVERCVTRLKALRARRADELGLEVGVLCPNGTLYAIARAEPVETAGLDALTDLRRWQREALGEETLLGAVRAD